MPAYLACLEGDLDMRGGAVIAGFMGDSTLDVHDLEWRQHGSCSESRGRSRGCRFARWTGAGDVRQSAGVDRIHQDRQAAAIGGDYCDAVGGASGHPLVTLCRATKPATGGASAHPGTLPPRYRQTQHERTTASSGSALELGGSRLTDQVELRFLLVVERIIQVFKAAPAPP